MYKIIKDNKVIDTVVHADFIRFLSPTSIIRTTESEAQGITGSDYKTTYSFVFVDSSIPVVTIEKIDVEEFNRLKSLLNSEQEVVANSRLLTTVKETVIAKLSDICKDKIISGFSTLLSDGQVYNFKLTAEDQLNLLSIENQLYNGNASFIYHATGMPCKSYSFEDMSKIIKAFRRHVLYHTTYFNTAKQYINSLTDLNKIKTFFYGLDISSISEDTQVRKILQDGGNV